VWGLQHHADTGLNVLQREIEVVSSTNADSPLGGFIKAAQQVDDRSFTTASWANERYSFTMIDVKTKVLNHGFVFFVVKGDIVEFNITRERCEWQRLLTVTNARLGIDE